MLNTVKFKSKIIKNLKVEDLTGYVKDGDFV